MPPIGSFPSFRLPVSAPCRLRIAANGGQPPLTGYCILNAESLEEAETLVRDMPIIESVRVYEAHSM